MSLVRTFDRKFPHNNLSSSFMLFSKDLYNCVVPIHKNDHLQLTQHLLFLFLLYKRIPFIHTHNKFATIHSPKTSSFSVTMLINFSLGRFRVSSLIIFISLFPLSSSVSFSLCECAPLVYGTA